MTTLFFILLFTGIFINLMSIVGLLRFPDVYTRLHAATKTTTFGSMFIIAAIIVMYIADYKDTSLTIIFHSLLALLVIIITNPISAHAIARAAMLSGVKPYGAELNKFAEKFKNRESVNITKNQNKD